MNISDLNTLVQLFATIYITIAVDIQFCQRFWSQGYYRTVTNNINKYGFSNSYKIQEELKNNIKIRANQLESASRRRGSFMFLFCLTLLIYNAFEYPQTKSCVHIFIYALSCSFVMAFSSCLLKQWYLLIILSILSSGFLLFVPCLGFVISHCSSLDQYLSLGVTKTLIIILLLTPVIWQLHSNWLHSVVYQKYLVENLNKIVIDYSTAIEAMRLRKPDTIPSAYENTLARMTVQNVRGMDLQLTEINKTFNELLVKACEQPRLTILLKYIFKDVEDIKQIKKSEFRNLPDAHQSVVDNPSDITENNVSSNSFSVDKKRNTDSFCSSHRKTKK